MTFHVQPARYSNTAPAKEFASLDGASAWARRQAVIHRVDYTIWTRKPLKRVEFIAHRRIANERT